MSTILKLLIYKKNSVRLGNEYWFKSCPLWVKANSKIIALKLYPLSTGRYGNMDKVFKILNPEF